MLQQELSKLSWAQLWEFSQFTHSCWSLGTSLKSTIMVMSLNSHSEPHSNYHFIQLIEADNCNSKGQRCSSIHNIWTCRSKSGTLQTAVYLSQDMLKFWIWFFLRWPPCLCFEILSVCSSHNLNLAGWKLPLAQSCHQPAPCPSLRLHWSGFTARSQMPMSCQLPIDQASSKLELLLCLSRREGGFKLLSIITL